LWAASWFAFFAWVMCMVIAVLRGKLGTAAIDVFFTFFAYVAAVRLAKPGSLWARRLYSPEKMRRAYRRYPPVHSLPKELIAPPIA